MCKIIKTVYKPGKGAFLVLHLWIFFIAKTKKRKQKLHETSGKIRGNCMILNFLQDEVFFKRPTIDT